VHISAACGALSAALVVGPRPDLTEHEKQIDHKARQKNYSYVLLGGGLLWFGWFGFNGGSAVASNGLATAAFVNTQIATGSAFTTWMVLDMIIKKEASAVGAMSGAVVGLVAITPASGFVPPLSSIVIGMLGVVATYFSIELKVKYFPKYFDDTLDVFSCHGIAGMAGCILTGFFASTDVNPGGGDGVFYGRPILLGYQITAIVATTLWSTTVSALILLALKYTIGLAVTNPAKLALGLDPYHGVELESVALDTSEVSSASQTKPTKNKIAGKSAEDEHVDDTENSTKMKEKKIKTEPLAEPSPKEDDAQEGNSAEEKKDNDKDNDKDHDNDKDNDNDGNNANDNDNDGNNANDNGVENHESAD